MLGVAAGRLLREDELIVHSDFEHAPDRGNQDELGQRVLELLQQPFRQTDGSRRVASRLAVLDRDPHGPECSGSSKVRSGSLRGAGSKMWASAKARR